ncbi:phage tail tape measure protein [Nitrobacter sp. TKz-YC02]|uniref:phage tail tape measure protein n=1 Tax=Nitrobacter sp. TKz-YC02 TaxID=3398704 RepID=UPI003CE8BA07
MSENIEVKTTLTAHDLASPVLKGFLANLKKLEANLKGFNSQFANLGRAGAASIAGINRDAESMIAKMNGVAASVKSASRSYADDWRRATDQRLSDARSMYRQLDRLERGHQRQLERRIAAERRTGFGREFGRARMPAPHIRTLMFGGAAAIGGVAGALSQRMKVEAAETKARMFGGLTPNEIVGLRKSFADRAGIVFGVGVTKAIETVVEGLKAGVDSANAAAFGELALQAQTGLDIDSGATAKLLGRITTLKGSFDKSYLGSVLNAVAVANNSTAADGNEIVEALRRSISATVATKISMQDLTAFDASAISVGIQPFKAGTFMSFLTSELANAKNARGQRGKDLNQAANILGLGGRSGLSVQMIAKPTETLLTIFDRMMQMPEALRAKVANLVGMREWSGELLQLAAARDLIAKTLTEIANKPNFLQSAALLKIKSMAGRWASIKAAFGLIVEKIGAGLTEAFDSVSNAVIDLAANFDFNTLKDHFAALTNGLRDGFGLKNWGDAVKSLASSFDAGSVNKWFKFGKGFAEGLRETVTMLKGAFTGIASLFGKGDAESMGKFTARLLGLTVALALVAPVVNVLGSISLFLLTIGAVASGAATGIAALFLALTVGLKLSLSWVADKIFGAFTAIVDPIVGAIKSIVTKTWGWLKGLFGFSPSSSGGASGSWEESSFSDTRKQVAAISASPASYSASPASYIGSDVSGVTGGALSRTAFESTFAGSALASQYDAINAAAKANGLPPALLAAVIAHETGRGRNVRGNNVAGLMNPETNFRTKQGFATINDGISAAGRVVGKNYRVAGGDLNRMGQRYAEVGAANDPNNLNAGWVSGVRSFRNRLSGGVGGAGYAGLGDPLSAAEQYLGKSEYTNRAELSNLIGHDVAGNANAWCARFVNTMLDKTGGKGTGSAIANSFLRYGERVIDKASVASGDVLVQPNGRGVDQPGGHVGFATGRTREVDGRLQLEMRSGNDGDSVRDSWRDASKLEVRRGLTANVPPADMIANVPPSSGSETSALLKRNGSAVLGNAGGPVAININGNSHDPEALATLVQRRIDEAMNWQMHDIGHALT